MIKIIIFQMVIKNGGGGVFSINISNYFFRGVFKKVLLVTIFCSYFYKLLLVTIFLVVLSGY